MKNKKPTSLIAALSLLLPASAFAQAGSTGSSGSSSQYPSTGSSSQSGSSQQYPSASTGRAGSTSQDPSTGSSTQSAASQQSSTGGASGRDSSFAGQTSGSHDQKFKLIKEDKLKEKKTTAENLRGKKVVDRDGRIVGTVRYIGVGSAMQDGASGSAQTFASSGSVAAGAPTGRSSGPGSSSTGISPSSGASVTAGSNQSEQVTFYVELDSNVGMEGDDFAAIPASRVQFDTGNEQLKLQLGRTELLSQLRQSGGSSSNR